MYNLLAFNYLPYIIFSTLEEITFATMSEMVMKR